MAGGERSTVLRSVVASTDVSLRRCTAPLDSLAGLAGTLQGRGWPQPQGAASRSWRASAFSPTRRISQPSSEFLSHPATFPIPQNLNPKPPPPCSITGFFDVAPDGDPNSVPTSALPRVPTLDGTRIGPPQILEDWEVELQPKGGGGGWFGGGSGAPEDDASLLRSLQRGDK